MNAQSPEEKRRHDLHSEISDETPERLLNLLTDIIENRDWETYDLSFMEYIETSFDDGGIGWNPQNLQAAIGFQHRNETQAKDKDYWKDRLSKMRSFVKEKLTLAAPTIIYEAPAPNPVPGVGTPVTLSETHLDPPVAEKPRARISRRLEMERPDLAEMVVLGEISMNAAAIQAGIRTRRVSIPMGNMEKTARSLRHHFTEEEIVQLCDLLLNMDTNDEQ